MSGEIIMTRYETEPLSVVIKRADRECRVADFFLRSNSQLEVADCIVVGDRTVRFIGINRTLVYLIDWDDYDPATRTYAIRRPSPRRAS